MSSNYNDIVSTMQNTYCSLWTSQSNTFRLNLKLIAFLKKSFQIENHVFMPSRSFQTPFCKLVISAHNADDTGKYLSPKFNLKKYFPSYVTEMKLRMNFILLWIALCIALFAVIYLSHYENLLI